MMLLLPVFCIHRHDIDHWVGYFIIVIVVSFQVRIHFWALFAKGSQALWQVINAKQQTHDFGAAFCNPYL